MSKYKSRKVTIDGITFDSKKESERYKELKLLRQAGIISNLELQKRFELQPSFICNGKRYRPIYYICDFYYNRDGEWIIEDVKSEITKKDKVYKLKKKMMAFKGLEITEV